GDAVVVEEAEHLDGEGLVDLEQADVVDGQAGLGEGLVGGGDRAVAHDRRVDARERGGDQAHADRQPQLGGNVTRGEQRGGGAVGQGGGVAGRDAAARAERRLEVRDALDGGPRAGQL